MADKGERIHEIRDNMRAGILRIMEWGITRDWACAYTLRNGNVRKRSYAKPYAEKIMMCEEGQVFLLCIFTGIKWRISSTVAAVAVQFEVYNATSEGNLADTDVIVSRDGFEPTFLLEAHICCIPGESLTLCPFFIMISLFQRDPVLP